MLTFISEQQPLFVCGHDTQIFGAADLVQGLMMRKEVDIDKLRRRTYYIWPWS